METFKQESETKENLAQEYLENSFEILSENECLHTEDLLRAKEICEYLYPTLKTTEQQPQYEILCSLGYGFSKYNKKTIEPENIKDIEPKDMAKLLFFETRGLETHRILANKNTYDINLEDIINKVYLFEKYNLNIKNLLVYTPEVFNYSPEEIEQEIEQYKKQKAFSADCMNLINQLEEEYKEANSRQPRNLTREEEQILFKGLQDVRECLQDKETLLFYKNQIREILVNYNSKLVFSIARKFFNLVPEGDVQSEEDILGCAYEGLVVAMRKFDYTKGNKFSTYATPWIKLKIYRGIEEILNTIPIPSRVVGNIKELQKEQESLLKDNQDLTLEETLDLLIQKGQIEENQRNGYFSALRARKLVSFDRELGPDTSFGEYLVDKKQVSVEELVFSRIARTIIMKELEKLTPAKRDAIILRFGLKDGIPMTPSQIWEISNLIRATTHNRVRRGLIELEESKILKELYHSDTD